MAYSIVATMNKLLIKRMLQVISGVSKLALN